jgi:hypothetical protein
MLNFPELPNKKLKVGAWVGGVLVTGVAIPLVACWYQQNKLKAA